MKRLIDWRHDEMTDVYHEKELLHNFLTMTHKLEKHIAGTPRTKDLPEWILCVFIISVISLS